MPKLSTIQKFGDNLFEDLDKLEATELEKAQLRRYRQLISIRLDNPSLTNKAVVALVESEFDISTAQAYRDLAEVEKVLGRISNTSKTWIRYTVVETLRESIALARAAGDHAEMIKAAAQLGKYSRLDKEDPQNMPYEDIVPPKIEYINDPAILGVSVPNPTEFVAKIKRKFITDVECVEIKDE